VVEFARRNQVTQIFLSRGMLRARSSPMGGKLVRNIIRLAHDMQIIVVASRRAERPESTTHGRTESEPAA